MSLALLPFVCVRVSSAIPSLSVLCFVVCRHCMRVPFEQLDLNSPSHPPPPSPHTRTTSLQPSSPVYALCAICVIVLFRPLPRCVVYRVGGFMVPARPVAGYPVQQFLSCLHGHPFASPPVTRCSHRRVFPVASTSDACCCLQVPIRVPYLVSRAPVPSLPMLLFRRLHVPSIVAIVVHSFCASGGAQRRRSDTFSRAFRFGTASSTRLLHFIYTPMCALLHSNRIASFLCLE